MIPIVPQGGCTTSLHSRMIGMRPYKLNCTLECARANWAAGRVRQALTAAEPALASPLRFISLVRSGLTEPELAALLAAAAATATSAVAAGLSSTLRPPTRSRGWGWLGAALEILSGRQASGQTSGLPFASLSISIIISFNNCYQASGRRWQVGRQVHARYSMALSWSSQTLPLAVFSHPDPS